MTMTKKSHVVNVPVPVDDPVPLVNIPAPDDAPIVGATVYVPLEYVPFFVVVVLFQLQLIILILHLLLIVVNLVLMMVYSPYCYY